MTYSLNENVPEVSGDNKGLASKSIFDFSPIALVVEFGTLGAFPGPTS